MKARSVIEPTRVVNGEASTSIPTAARRCAAKVRISASPRWPALPVTRMVMGRGNGFLAAPSIPARLGRSDPGVIDHDDLARLAALLAVLDRTPARILRRS